MSNPESNPRPAYISIHALLSDVALQASELEKDGSHKLHFESDATGFREALARRAELITRLPELLNEFRSTGRQVPDEVDTFAAHYASAAEHALDKDASSFLLSTILNPSPGGYVGDPNELEKLAMRYALPPEA